MPEHVGLAAGDGVTRWQAGAGPVRASRFCAPESHAAGAGALGAPHPQPLLGGSTMGLRQAQLWQIAALNSQIAPWKLPAKPQPLCWGFGLPSLAFTDS